MAIPLVTVLNNLKTVQIAQVPCFGGRVPWRELNITHYHSVCECVCRQECEGFEGVECLGGCRGVA